MKELSLEPRGLFWQDEFITPEHEAELLHIFKHELVWPASRSATPTRLSLHYGYTFDYKTFGVDPSIPYKPFPAWLEPLIPTTEGRPPDQVCLQWYPPGAGIPPHADTHSAYDQLYALSLGGAAVMQFRKGGAGGEERAEVDLTPRSMLRMSGDARLHWTHGIKKRKTDTLSDGTVRVRQDRWSITYRWLRAPRKEGAGAGERECECGDLALCDTAQRRAGIEREYRWKEAGKEDGKKTGKEVVKEVAPIDKALGDNKNG
ncbi:2OG-Fe(II) oxygenase superfamily protein [Daldinia bambusicola]|nr:2OG-Fe(II) oxygenase superfamily protein [Daldinia bambusicola]